MFSSVTLHHRRSRRIINADLRHAQHPPWSGKDQQEWIMRYHRHNSKSGIGRLVGIPVRLRFVFTLI